MEDATNSACLFGVAQACAAPQNDPKSLHWSSKDNNGRLGRWCTPKSPNTHMPQLEMQDVDIDMICDPQTHVGLPILKSTFRFQISMLERNLFDSMSIFDNAKFHALHILVILAPLLISVHHTPTTLRLHYLAECDGVWSE